MTATPSTTALWNEEVAARRRLPYAYLCFNTNDRLSYDAWQHALWAHDRIQSELLDRYEAMIRKAFKAK